MKKKLLSITFIFLIFLTGLSAQNELKVGTKIPKINYQISYPKNYKIPIKKPILVDFWATWCPPCVQGLILTNDLVKKYSEKIDFIAITDQTSSNIETFIKKKNINHNIIVDTTGITFESFGVHGIPFAFIVDKNGIIQWTGHGSQVTSALLDEFLKNGRVDTPKPRSISQTNTSTDIKSDKSVRLIINDKTLPDLEDNCMSTRFKPDTFKFKMSQFPLLKAIEGTLFNYTSYRIIYRNIPLRLKQKKISVDYLADNVDVEKTKMYLINSIGNYCGFSAKKQSIDTVVWKLSISDSTKLAEFSTSLTAKQASYGIGSSVTGIDKDGKFSCLNYSVSDMANLIEQYFHVYCNCEMNNTTIGYDFIKVNGSSFNSVQKELHDKYGLKFTECREKIEFLVIEGN